MLKNYALIALRNISRHKGYTFINVAGLAVGLAACLLIFLFVRDEYSYDRFHEDADRIYRVVQRGESLSTSSLLAPTMERDFPEVERAVRISRLYREVLVTHNGESFYEDRFYFTDSTFFDVFSFPLLQGNARTALTRPFTVIITEAMAQKYFGDENPMGRTLNLKGYWDAYDFEITGVARTPPHNSHFTFNFLASFATRYESDSDPEHIDNWMYVGDLTYILLEEGQDIGALKAKMPAFFLRHRKLVVLAVVGSAPLAYLLAERWLQEFPYRIEISWQIFLMAGLMALLVAFLTVSYQAIKAAQTNPSESLRYE